MSAPDPALRHHRAWRAVVGVVAALVALAGLATPASAAGDAPADIRPRAGLEARGDLVDLPSVFAAGTAADYGSTDSVLLSGPLRDLVRTSTGQGYWLLGADGGVFTYGDAAFLGSTGGIVLNKPAVAMASTGSGAGYWFVASDGGVFAFGDAGFYGSTGGIRLNAPVVGMVPTATGRGYFLVASDGGVFTFGDATFRGSGGGSRLPSPAVALTAKPDGTGYWLLLEDGTVVGYGSAAPLPLNGTRIDRGVGYVDIQATPTCRGYWTLDADGQVVPYGDARTLQPQVSVNPGGRAVALASTPDGSGVWVATSGRIRAPSTAGSTGPFSFLVLDAAGRPGRWNPCAGPIRYLFNPRLAPSGGEQLLIDAFDYVGAITGLAFAYGGTTTEDPRTARVDGAIVVGWVEPFDAVGRGGSQYRRGASGGLVATNGAVFLNASYIGTIGVSWRGGAWGPVLLHELGHVLNLGHVDDPNQLMAAINTGQADFGSGDLAGLDRLGASQGCA
jgi:hypothetical protein